MSELRHSRSLSRDSNHRAKSPRSLSPPSQTYHPNILPRSVPTPALVESVAGGAHYSGVRVDSDVVLKHRRSSSHSAQKHTDLKCDHERIMKDLKELYCCRPTLEIFERSWNKDAVFEDPLCRCQGFNEYAAQWFALPKFFSKSVTISSRVMSSTHSPNRLVYYQTQEYTTKWLHRKKIIESVIVVDLDDNEKIIRMVDQWSGKELPAWFGSGLLRSLNAKLTPWFIRIPKATN
ncbi:hypothetical protein BDQ12DRAFT_677006 [Crucibulum laeve]|uniref:Uncharacterized protein n=1 Tax=Crucibulum laeve TaxID=68775 RepID=A0A5C3MBX7_9AGAR|nr:hypothetical protein BDQ12DRAFT_677006 [Crucibulum laeve]